jgi:hypothetical protein
MLTTRVALHVARLGALVLLTAFATSVFAQSNKGTIKGTITDQNGGIVQSATVTALNTQTGIDRTVNSNEDGTYEIPSLDPGI